MNAMTAAHRTLPFGTVVRVTNLENRRSIRVRINDRGPYVGDRILDLSAAAARSLGLKERGVARVRIEIVTEPARAAPGRPPAPGAHDEAGR